MRKIKLSKKYTQEIKLENHLINIDYCKHSEDWRYWNIEIWGESTDNYVEELCVFEQPKDSYNYNLNLVNMILKSLDIELFYEGENNEKV